MVDKHFEKGKYWGENERTDSEKEQQNLGPATERPG